MRVGSSVKRPSSRMLRSMLYWQASGSLKPHQSSSRLTHSGSDATVTFDRLLMRVMSNETRLIALWKWVTDLSRRKQRMMPIPSEAITPIYYCLMNIPTWTGPRGKWLVSQCYSPEMETPGSPSRPIERTTPFNFTHTHFTTQTNGVSFTEQVTTTLPYHGNRSTNSREI